jgi:hypothetical protein
MEDRPRGEIPALPGVAPQRLPGRATSPASGIPAESRPRSGPAARGLLAEGPPASAIPARPGLVRAEPPQRAAAPAQRPASRPQQSVVNIRIGRLEVRAAARQTDGGAPAPGRPKRDPVVSLEKYLAGEGGRR